MRQKSSYRSVVVVLLILVAAAAGLVANRLLFPPIPGSEKGTTGLRSATTIPQPVPLKPFSLVDHRGGAFTEKSLIGNWTLLSFGYTHCPDICPTTLQMLSLVEKKLSENGSAQIPEVVFVSIDPERDTRERLAGYVPYFNPGFTGVTGTLEGLKRLTGQLGVIFERAGNAPEDYLVNHSASIILIDPVGRFKAVFSVPHDAEVIAGDFQLIAAGG